MGLVNLPSPRWGEGSASLALSPLGRGLKGEGKSRHIGTPLPSPETIQVGTSSAPKKRVFLTFDDGPCDPFTAQVLDVLKDNGARATFFVCGMNVERYPTLARRVVGEGHSIGNHTYSHSKARAFTGIWGNEIERAQAAIEAITGVQTRTFRPPWGLMRPWLARRLEASGYRCYLWDMWARDWEKPGRAVIARRVVDRVRPGSIVLLHDGEKALAATDRSQTVLALQDIIAALARQGYSFEAL
ncbi:MAG: polysaccharide deacetylase family protein [Chloroflexi bacterium]|nr:polysaccharide deacetylase family protein [Chloroflexota bacterium]